MTNEVDSMHVYLSTKMNKEQLKTDTLILNLKLVIAGLTKTNSKVLLSSFNLG